MNIKPFLILSVLLISVTSTQGFVQLALDSNIKEISRKYFVDKSGYVHVVGEIQNTANEKIDFVKASVAYYDSQDKIIGTGFANDNRI